VQTVGIGIDKYCSARTIRIAVDKYCSMQTDGIAVNKHQEKKKLCPESPDALDALYTSDATCLSRTQFAMAPCIRTQLATASAYRMERVRAFSFWTQPCQGIFLLDAAVSGHFPSGHSRVRAFSFWTLPCQGKWRLDDTCHGTTVMLAVKVGNIAANTLVAFANTQWVPGIVTQSSSIHSI